MVPHPSKMTLYVAILYCSLFRLSNNPKGCELKCKNSILVKRVVRLVLVSIEMPEKLQIHLQCLQWISVAVNLQSYPFLVGFSSLKWMWMVGRPGKDCSKEWKCCVSFYLQGTPHVKQSQTQVKYSQLCPFMMSTNHDTKIHWMGKACIIGVPHYLKGRGSINKFWFFVNIPQRKMVPNSGNPNGAYGRQLLM